MMTLYDEAVMRTIIDLPEEQVSALARWCDERKISRAEAIRRALAVMLTNQQQVGRVQAFGAWKRKDMDSRSFVENLRKEWDT